METLAVSARSGNVFYKLGRRNGVTSVPRVAVDVEASRRNAARVKAFLDGKVRKTDDLFMRDKEEEDDDENDECVVADEVGNEADYDEFGDVINDSNAEAAKANAVVEAADEDYTSDSSSDADSDDDDSDDGLIDLATLQLQLKLKPKQIAVKYFKRLSHEDKAILSRKLGPDEIKRLTKSKKADSDAAAARAQKDELTKARALAKLYYTRVCSQNALTHRLVAALKEIAACDDAATRAESLKRVNKQISSSAEKLDETLRRFMDDDTAPLRDREALRAAVDDDKTKLTYAEKAVKKARKEE